MYSTQMSAKPKVAIVASHPVQYKVPLYRELTERARIELEVLYKSRHGVEASYSPGLKQSIRFDVNLLEGYRHKFLKNWGIGPAVEPPWGQITPFLFRHLKSSDYDLVVLNGYNFVADWIAAGAARFHEIPYMLRTESILMFNGPLTRGFIRDGLVRLMIRGAGGALVVGERNEKFYQHYCRDIPLYSSPYSVDNEFFQGQEVRDSAKIGEIAAGYDLDPDLPTICFCGKLIPRKRPGDVLDVVRLADRDIQAVIVGSGPLMPELERDVAEMGLSDHVKLCGFVNQSELGDIYSLADVFVLPSEEDTWGLVVNEAMNFGVPVVVTERCGCAADLVDEGETGFVVPVGDIETLTERVERALLMVERNGQKVWEAVRAKISTYSIEESARGFEKAAESVM